MKALYTVKMVVALAAGLTAASLPAQMPGPAAVGAMNAGLTKLFGDIKACTAQADVRVLDANQKENLTMPLGFALLDEKVRYEVDMSQMKTRDMPEGAAGQLQKMGMAHVISLIRPDKKVVYVVYPDAKVMMALPMEQADADSAFAPVKDEKTELGKETLDGHACVKYKEVITAKTGRSFEATTWRAKDLKDFPLQIETQEQGTDSFIHFKDVHLEKPDAKLFDPPAGFTEYKDPQDLMQGIMRRMAENAGKSSQPAAPPK